jgi:hypothetical protein
VPTCAREAVFLEAIFMRRAVKAIASNRQPGTAEMLSFYVCSETVQAHIRCRTKSQNVAKGMGSALQKEEL